MKAVRKMQITEIDKQSLENFANESILKKSGVDPLQKKKILKQYFKNNFLAYNELYATWLLLLWIILISFFRNSALLLINLPLILIGLVFDIYNNNLQKKKQNVRVQIPIINNAPKNKSRVILQISNDYQGVFHLENDWYHLIALKRITAINNQVKLKQVIAPKFVQIRINLALGRSKKPKHQLLIKNVLTIVASVLLTNIVFNQLILGKLHQSIWQDNLMLLGFLLLFLLLNISFYKITDKISKSPVQDLQHMDGLLICKNHLIILQKSHYGYRYKACYYFEGHFDSKAFVKQHQIGYYKNYLLAAYDYARFCTVIY